MKLTRGQRNNNPLNIRHAKQKWVGEIEGEDKDFCTFASMGCGFRAALIIILNYMTKYNLHTIEKIIRRWAPPVENDTLSYINNVCRMTGIARDQYFGFDDVKAVVALIQAMAIVESRVTGFQATILSEYQTLCKKRHVHPSEDDLTYCWQNELLIPQQP